MSPKICKQCGAPMSSDSPEGLCARCLLSVAIKEPSGPAPEPASAPAVEEIGGYFPQLEILELLGRGGMGMVYKARQLQLDRIIALKILPPEAGTDPQFAERFAREARALAKLNHPNIVAVYEFGQTAVGSAGEPGLFYLIMEFVDGANLRQMMRAGGIKPEQALAIVPRICEALQYAHDEGIMHRDIKPENILVDKKGRVKIADFGLAKLLGRESTDFSLTVAGMSVGTPRYMAPEQMDHPNDVDHRADIYSLGVVFYEMLTGEVPVGRFALPSEKAQIDVRLDEVVLRSLERDVERRYQHVSEVKSDVENISGILSQLPPAVRQMLGFEYRSKTSLFGLPLVHMAFGLDPKTGKRRVARGIIALGERAQGVIAFGGIAMGGVAFGGIGIGVISFSGMSIGLLAIGGFALGLLCAYGGVAIAPFAWGGLAVGYVAVGGAAFGVHAAGGNARDPVGMHYLRHWSGPLNALCLALLPFVVIVPICGRLLGQRLARRAESQGATTAGHAARASAPKPAVPPADLFWRRLALTVLALFLLIPGCVAVMRQRALVQQLEARRAESAVRAESAPPAPSAPAAPSAPSPRVERGR